MVYHKQLLVSQTSGVTWVRGTMVFGLCSRPKSPYFLWRCINIKFYGRITTNTNLGYMLVLSSVCSQVFCARSYDIFMPLATSIILDIDIPIYLPIHINGLWTSSSSSSRSVLLGAYHFILHIVYVIIRLWFFTFLSSFIIQIIYLVCCANTENSTNSLLSTTNT